MENSLKQGGDMKFFLLTVLFVFIFGCGSDKKNEELSDNDAGMTAETDFRVDDRDQEEDAMPDADHSAEHPDSKRDADQTAADYDEDIPEAPEAPEELCSEPVKLYDTSKPDHVIGDGTLESCTEEKIESAIQAGGIITFNCGEDAVIKLSREHKPPVDKDTIIDGENRVTLDGQLKNRFINFEGKDWQKTETKLVIQRIMLKNFKAPATDMFEKIDPNPNNCSQGYFDGDGGAIKIRDGILHVVDSIFIGNVGAEYGPDTAGGAIRLLGTSEAVISGSRFVGNKCSNGGAVGLLFGGNVTFVNNIFEQNEATGWGANYIDKENCPPKDPEKPDSSRVAGSGGNGGALYSDGADRKLITVCGNVFKKNSAGAFGGVMFRTENKGGGATIKFIKNLFTNNETIIRDSERGGGGVLYMNGNHVIIDSCTFYQNRSGKTGGAIQTDTSNLDIINSSFIENEAPKGLGGAIADFNESGTITNCTFSGNKASDDSGKFAGAIFQGKGYVIKNTIFANHSGSGAGAKNTTCSGDPRSGSKNIQWPDEGHTACGEGTTFLDPKLNLSTEDEIVMIPQNKNDLQIGKECPEVDQLGNKRAEICTVGAIELGR